VKSEWLKKNPKSEGRNPKEIRNPKSETATALAQLPGDGSPLTTRTTDAVASGFGFRASFGFRPSDFGFQTPTHRFHLRVCHALFFRLLVAA